MKIIIIKSSYPEALKSYNFVWNINIFQPFSIIVVTKSFMFYLRSRVIPEKKAFEFFQVRSEDFGTVVINDWKTIFDITIVLNITIFPSSVRFLNFHIFSTHRIPVTAL